MLVLGRSEGQMIIIGEGDDAVVITVSKITQKHVRLSFEAPANVPIHREEVYKKIHGNLPVQSS